MNKFTSVNGDLFINSKKVLKAWESFSGWYWFAVKKVRRQDSIIDDKVVEGNAKIRVKLWAILAKLIIWVRS